ncbi:MAG: SUMF1/EgtB/PvdO family nonheme iron enzyme [Nitrospirae bacterium]|nr:SUMF1/EgtB/PvdO family nonheme iron enzyme [Nitrospirota bacterium]
MEFVFVKGGCYKMGDVFGDGNGDEKPAHEVCINDFYMGKYMVTQHQWKDIMGDEPSLFSDCGDNCPVDKVSWNDIQEFIRKLNRKTGKNYRLPTEAEWEYAARSGGKKEKWSGTGSEAELGKYAWFDNNSEEKTHPVGKRKPNGLGLYDMSGNVWEWCQDWYGESYYSTSPVTNPAGPPDGQDKILRGGSWFNGPKSLRTASRAGFDPGRPYVLGGFRLVAPSRP